MKRGKFKKKKKLFKIRNSQLILILAFDIFYFFIFLYTGNAKTRRACRRHRSPTRRPTALLQDADMS